MKNVKFSMLFFYASVLCITAPAVHEMLSVPWAALKNENVNETVMREPPPLSIDYIEYDDWKRQAAEQKAPEYLRLGAVKIPRIDISENLLEGATGKILDHGIGHVEGTAMPGEKGNSVISAHRVSNKGMEPFRYLDKIRQVPGKPVLHGRPLRHPHRQ